MLTEHHRPGSPGAYVLSYLPEYLQNPEASPICVHLPLRAQPFTSLYLFPYFESILPESDFAQRIARENRIDPADRFGLLLKLAAWDTIGDVTVRKS